MMPKPIKFDEHRPSDLLFDRGKSKSPPRAGVPSKHYGAHVCLARGRGRSKDARMNCSSAFCDTSLKSAHLNISRSSTELLNGFRQTSVIVRVFIWRA